MTRQSLCNNTTFESPRVEKIHRRLTSQEQILSPVVITNSTETVPTTKLETSNNIILSFAIIYCHSLYTVKVYRMTANKL